MKKDYLELGQIVGTHGIKGEMRINPWCDSPDFAKGFKTVYFDSKGTQPVKVSTCRPHGNVILMKLESINTMSDAEKMKNRMLYIRREDARLPEGTWFIEELIGCSVLDADSDKCYGKISDISPTGANDVWHISDENNIEFLIPAIKDVVVDVNVEDNIVKIRPMKGIFDDED